MSRRDNVLTDKGNCETLCTTKPLGKEEEKCRGMWERTQSRGRICMVGVRNQIREREGRKKIRRQSKRKNLQSSTPWNKQITQEKARKGEGGSFNSIDDNSREEKVDSEKRGQPRENWEASPGDRGNNADKGQKPMTLSHQVTIEALARLEEGKGKKDEGGEAIK